MAASLFDEAASRSDPQLNVDWRVQLLIPGNSVDITSYVESVKLPSVRLTQQQVHREGRAKQIADREEIGTATLKFYEDSLLTSYMLLFSWMRKIRSARGVFAAESAYKGAILLTPLSSTGVASVELEIVGAWPMGIPEYLFESGNAERLSADVEFSCDDVIPKRAGGGTYPSASSFSPSRNNFPPSYGYGALFSSIFSELEIGSFGDDASVDPTGSLSPGEEFVE